jgi:hypothetical protein
MRRRLSSSGAEQRGFGERFAFIRGPDSRHGRDRSGRRAANSGRLIRVEITASAHAALATGARGAASSRLSGADVGVSRRRWSLRRVAASPLASSPGPSSVSCRLDRTLSWQMLLDSELQKRAPLLTLSGWPTCGQRVVRWFRCRTLGPPRNTRGDHRRRAPRTSRGADVLWLACGISDLAPSA